MISITLNTKSVVDIPLKRQIRLTQFFNPVTVEFPKIRDFVKNNPKNDMELFKNSQFLQTRDSVKDVIL